tara:strand:- start:14445 stop:18389 length:3945 start_codon:yes stop_codon:yes gene_type:complete
MKSDSSVGHDLPSGHGKDCSTSLGQRGFALAHEMYGSHEPLNTGLAIELQGHLDRQALKRSFDKLVERHGQLRTTFHIGDSGLAARVHGVKTQPWRVIDLAGLSSAEQSDRLGQVERTEVRHHFDLAHLPLLRVTLVVLSEVEHVLILVSHHISADGTSLFKIYLDELAQLYAAFGAGYGDPLPVLDLCFDDFVNQQQSRCSGRLLERNLNFWSEHLRGAPPHVELPSDYQRPAMPTGAGGRVEGPVCSGLGERVAEFAIKADSTPVAVLLGAFYTLLFRYSHQADMVIGLPVANRPLDLEGVFGPMINTLPIRARVSEGMTFAELVAQVERTTFRAFMRRDVPFETIVSHTQQSRDLSRSAIHQIVFNYQTFSAHSAQLLGLRTTVRRLSSDAALLDLVVDAEERSDGLCVSVNYNADIYNADLVARLIASFHVLLEVAMNSPETPLVKLPLQSADQLSSLAVTRNQTWCEFPEDLSIQAAFEAQVDRAPDAIAVRCAGVALTYAELDDRANCLAHQLRDMGAGRDRIVALCLPRQSDMLTGLLAILKSGAAYLPLDPQYPHERLDFMLDDSEAAIVVTVADSKHLVVGEGRQVVLLDSFNFKAGVRSRPEAVNESSDLAYVIYTSGSTGKPKGVMVEHRNVSNFFTAMDEVVDLVPRTAAIWVAVGSISFDMSVLEIFVSLCRGFTVVLQADGSEASNSPASLILEHQATMLVCTPSQARMLLAEPAGGDALACLDLMMLGGEALPADLACKLGSKVRGVVVNGYGLTETTICSAFHVLREEEDGLTIPIGRPVANTALYVLDKELQLAPQGVIGELFIGGAGVARGYLRREALTAARFVTDPFLASHGRMYRTGDLVRYREDGTLQYIGRTDLQVKLRGHRIEIGEVEAHVANLNGVEETVAVVREDVLGDQKLVAFVVVTGDFDEARARSELGQVIPDYMVPNLFAAVEELPLTPNGKVDRTALPSPRDTVKSRVGNDFIAPRNDVEVRLSSLWRELLGVIRVGVRDNYFDLGGHSLLTLELASRIGAEFESTFEPAQVFMFPTIEGQAQVLQGLGSMTNRAIVTLQKHGEGLPIYCVCGIHLYQELAESLGEDQPFLAVYVPEELAFLRNAQEADTIEGLARVYYQMILANHDGRALRLLGFCFGGALAYEIALLAEADGVAVDSVILLDSVIWSRLKRRNLRRAFKFVRRFLTHGAREELRRLATRRRSQERKKSKILDDSARALTLGVRMLDYVPCRPLKARAILVSSRDPDIHETWRLSPLLGWEGYLKSDTSTIVAASSHRGILRQPAIKGVAERLRVLLANPTV